MTAILQIKKLRFREVGCLAQSLTAMNGVDWGSYQGGLISSPCFQAGVCTSLGREYAVRGAGGTMDKSQHSGVKLSTYKTQKKLFSSTRFEQVFSQLPGVPSASSSENPPVTGRLALGLHGVPSDTLNSLNVAPASGPFVLI